MDSRTLNTISLCSGVVMLDEGVHAGLEFMGIRSRTVMFAEREAFPVSVLAARMEEGSLAPAPIWFGDFTELPAKQFHGVVDGVVAGFPCQDLSVAGRRAGLNGKRSGLFFNVLDIADASGAWFLVLENVAGIASATASVVDEEEGELEERAAARVMGELADRGWDSEWITLSASDVGASHGRARWFCFAWRMDDSARHGRNRLDGQVGRGRGICQTGDPMDDAQLPERWAQRIGGTGGVQRHECGRTEEDGGTGIADKTLADALRIRSKQGSRIDGGKGSAQRSPKFQLRDCNRGESLADAPSARPQGQQRRGGANQNGREITHGSISECRSIFAPGPADYRWTGLLGQFPWLAPAIADEEAESLLRGVADGMASGLDFSYRAARLRAGGNGVVPLCAASAVVVLVRRSGIF